MPPGLMDKLSELRGLDATADNAVFLNYAEAVGGSTVHYWGDSIRTPHDRLERWRTESGLDWMTPAGLDPHFTQIEQELGIHVAGEELQRFERATAPEREPGRGEREPVASNDTAAGRARNRRVEIFVQENPA